MVWLLVIIIVVLMFKIAYLVMQNDINSGVIEWQRLHIEKLERNKEERK